MSVSFADVSAALDRIRPLIVSPTPVITCGAFHLKLESLQKTGSFKARGALNALLARHSAGMHVVAHSTGNHGIAVAWAAAQLGTACTIVVPHTCAPLKLAMMQLWGPPTIVQCDAAERAARADAIARESNAVLLSPYDDPLVIAGQGTIAIELLSQVADLDAIVVPASGGGLISGIAVAAKHLRPSIRIVAATPEHKMLGEAIATRNRTPGSSAPLATIVDAMLTKHVGAQHCWPIVSELVDHVIEVSDDDVAAAMRQLFERAKIVVEPAGAVAWAAVHRPEFAALGLTRVALVVCGGNIGLTNFIDLTKRS